MTVITTVAQIAPVGSVAGALGIQPGGPNNYFGERVTSPGSATRSAIFPCDDISVNDSIDAGRFNPRAGAVYCKARCGYLAWPEDDKEVLYPAAPNY